MDFFSALEKVESGKRVFISEYDSYIGDNTDFELIITHEVPVLSKNRTGSDSFVYYPLGISSLRSKNWFEL